MYKYCYSNIGIMYAKVYELTIACFSRIEMCGSFCHYPQLHAFQAVRLSFSRVRQI